MEAFIDGIEQVLSPVASVLGCSLEARFRAKQAVLRLSVSSAASDVQHQGRLVKQLEVFEGISELQLVHQLATPPVILDAQHRQLALPSPLPARLHADVEGLQSAAAVLLQQLMLQLLHEPQLLHEQLDTTTAAWLMAMCSQAVTHKLLRNMCSGPSVCPSVDEVLTALQPCTPDAAPQVQPSSPDSVAKVRLLLTTPPAPHPAAAAAAASAAKQQGMVPAACKMVALLERLQLVPQGGAGRQEVVAALRRLLQLTGHPAAASPPAALSAEPSEAVVADALLQRFALPLQHVVAAAAAASAPGDAATGVCSACGLGAEPRNLMVSCSRCAQHCHVSCANQVELQPPSPPRCQQQLCPSCQDSNTAAVEAWEFGRACVQRDAALCQRLMQLLSEQQLELLLQGSSEQEELEGCEAWGGGPGVSPAAACAGTGGSPTACLSSGTAAVEPHGPGQQAAAGVMGGDGGAAAAGLKGAGAVAAAATALSDGVSAWPSAVEDLIIPSSCPEENEECEALRAVQLQGQQGDKRSLPGRQQQQQGEELVTAPAPAPAAAAEGQGGATLVATAAAAAAAAAMSPDGAAAAAPFTAHAATCAGGAAAASAAMAAGAGSSGTQQPAAGIKRQLSGAQTASAAGGAAGGAQPGTKRHRLSRMSLPGEQQQDGPGQQAEGQGQHAGLQQQFVVGTPSAAAKPAPAAAALQQPSEASQSADPTQWSAGQLLGRMAGCRRWSVLVEQVLVLQRDVCARHPEALVLQELHLYLSSQLLQERLQQVLLLRQQVVECVQALVASLPCPAVRALLLQLVSQEADADAAEHLQQQQGSQAQGEQLLLAVMLLGTFLPLAFQQTHHPLWKWGMQRGVDRAWSLIRGDVQLQQCLNTFAAFRGHATVPADTPPYDCRWGWEWDWKALTGSAVGCLKQLLQQQLQLDVAAGPCSLNLQLLLATFQEVYSVKQPQDAAVANAGGGSSSVCGDTEGPSALLSVAWQPGAAPADGDDDGEAGAEAPEGVGQQPADPLAHLAQRRSLLCELVRELAEFASGVWREVVALAGADGVGPDSCNLGPPPSQTQGACSPQAAAAREAAAAAAAWAGLKAPATAAGVAGHAWHPGRLQAAAVAACAVPLASLAAAAAEAEYQGVRGALQICGALLVNYFQQHTPYMPGPWAPCLPFDCAAWQTAHALCREAAWLVDWRLEPVGALAACMAAYWELWGVNRPSGSANQGLFSSRCIWEELVATEPHAASLMQWASREPLDGPVEAAGWLLLKRLFAVVRHKRLSLVPPQGSEERPLDEELLLLFIKSARLQHLTRYLQRPFSNQPDHTVRVSAAARRLAIGQVVMPELGSLLEALFSVPLQQVQQHFQQQQQQGEAAMAGGGGPGAAREEALVEQQLQLHEDVASEEEEDDEKGEEGIEEAAGEEALDIQLQQPLLARQLLKGRLDSSGRLVVSACTSVLDLLLLPDEELLQQAAYITPGEPLAHFIVARLTAATQALQQPSSSAQLETQLRHLQDYCNRRHQPALADSVPSSQLW